MPRLVKDFDCQNSLNEEISEKKDPDEDLYFDEELDSYLSQFEAIPIEVCEENCGDSSDDGSEECKDAVAKRTQAASRNTPECPSTADETESPASASSFTAKTVFNVVQKKVQEEDSKLSVASINRQVGSDLQEDLSIAVCGQMISRSGQKTVRADTAKNTYWKCKEESSEEESFSAFENTNRITGSEDSPARTGITTYVTGVSKLETDPQRTMTGREKKERDYSKNCLTDNKTENSVNAEKILEESVSSTREQGGMETDIISCVKAACRLEIESQVPQSVYSDGSNAEDGKNLISLDIISTEHNLLRCRRDSSSSLSSSFSGRETVILPLDDPRLPCPKEEQWCPSPNKLKTCVLGHGSSSESMSQSLDAIGVISDREPSPFPISKTVSDNASCQIASSVIETKNYLALPKADHLKTSSDCIVISSDTCESDLERRSSPLLSPVTLSQSNSDSCKGKWEVLQSKLIARKQGPRTPLLHTPPRVTASDPSTLGDIPFTPPPPMYSGSESARGMLHNSKISPISVSTVQQTEELGAPTDSRSDCSAKAEVESRKLKDNLHGSCVVQGTKFSTLNDSKPTSFSREHRTVDCKSLSPVSSSSSRSPVRKSSRSRTVDRKSTSPVSSCSLHSPVKKRSKSRTVDHKSTSPVSSSSSHSPVRKRSRSRTVDCKSMSPVSSCSSRSPVKKRSKSRTVDRKYMSPVRSFSSHSPVRKRSRSRTVDHKSTSPVSSSISFSPVKKRYESRTVDHKSTSPVRSSSSHSPVRKRSRSRTVDHKSTSPVSSSISYSPVKKRYESRTVDHKSMSPVRSSSSHSPVRKRSRSRIIDRKSMSPVSSSSSHLPVKKRSRSRTVDHKSVSPVSICSTHSPVMKRSGSRTVDCKSMSPVSSCSSYSPVRKGSRSRRQRRNWKSQSLSPFKYRRQSRSVSPLRRKWDNQRSYSKSGSPPRWQLRSRSPRRRRARSRSPIISRHCRSRSRGRRSRSPSRGSTSPRRGSRCPRRGSRSRRNSQSPRRGSRSPRRYSRSPRKYSRSPRRYSRVPRRYSRSPRRYSRSPRRVTRKRRKRSSSLSLSPSSAAERRMRLKEKTETALCSIVAALNGTQTTTAVSVIQRQTAPAANTVSSVPMGALPPVKLTKVQ